MSDLPCVVLAIDPGKVSGWALLEPGATGYAPQYATGTARTAKEILEAVRLALAVERDHDWGWPLVVVGESWRNAGGRGKWSTNVRTLTGIGASWGRWESIIELEGHPKRRVLRLDTGTWRSRAYGGRVRRKGEEWKAMARQYASRHLPGAKPETDDEAEAIVLAHVALRSPEVAAVLPGERAKARRRR